LRYYEEVVVKFISFGDIHEYAENVQKIDGISDADFVVITGDD